MRNLYELFRDGVIEDATRLGLWGTAISPWSFFHSGTPHVGRVQTLALIRRYMVNMAREFPNGATVEKGHLVVTKDLLDFVQTSREIGHTMKKTSEAWCAMQDVTE